MGLRRNRPEEQTVGLGSVGGLTLRDGSTVSISLGKPRPPAAEQVCCFCGEDVDPAGPGIVELDARRAGEDTTRRWSAHEACLAERLHDRVT